MVPWRTATSAPHVGSAVSVLDVEWQDLPGIVFPIYGHHLPSRAGGISQCVWLLAASAWILLAFYVRRRQDSTGRVERVSREPWQVEVDGPSTFLVRWFGTDPGPYHNSSLSVSLYLMLTAGIFCSGLYCKSDTMTLNNPWSFSGDEYEEPDGFARRWCCAILAMVASLLLAVRLLCNVQLRGVLDSFATASIWGLFLVYVRQRHHALFVFRDPHHSIVAMDFMLFGIIVARTSEALGAPRWLCSSFLRKYVLMTFAVMYYNAGHSKLVNSGLVWFNGQAVYNLVLQYRSNSAWPWLSETILQSPTSVQIAGYGAFAFELVIPIFVLLSLLWFWPHGTWKGVILLRVGLVLMALGFHVFVYVILCPSFATFVHALLALGMDPIAWLGFESDVLEDQIIGVEQGTGLEEARETNNKLVGAFAVQAEKPKRLSLGVITSVWFLCLFTWVHVGVAFPQQDHHWLLPFSSLHMWSEEHWMHSRRGQAPVVQQHKLQKVASRHKVFMPASNSPSLLELQHVVQQIEL